MQNVVTAFFFGLTGAIIGFLIPDACETIAAMKYGQKGAALKLDRRYTTPLLKCLTLVLNTAAWAVAGYVEDNKLSAFILAILFTHAILFSIIDLRIHIIPNELVLTMAATGIAFQMAHNGFEDLLTAALIAIGLVALFTAAVAMTGFDKVGAGDIKLVGAMTLALGYPHIVTALLIMSIVFVIGCAVGLLTHKLTLQSMLPLAPFMMTGMTVSLVYIM